MFAPLVLSLALAALCSGAPSTLVNNEWYRNALVYQVYPRSFKDSNGDGIGDLNGITSKLEHIADIGADAVWLSPIYTSPQVDFGYDITNFTNVDKDYGTLADFDRLVAKAKSLGLKVILDFVPNHSSPEHEWFKKSVQRIKPYDEFYVWKDAKIINGTRHPPNNWLCSFQGSAWEWNNVRKQYYLHQFAIGQPDLNYRSPALNQAMKDVLTFWMNRGVEGFRVDAINVLVEDARFLDEPKSNRPGLPVTDPDSLNHIYTSNQDETYDVVKSWRQTLDEHARKNKGQTKMMLTEAYTSIDMTMKYYNYGSNAPFNFMLMGDLNERSSAADFKRFIDRWFNNIPGKDFVPNWVVGNHDNHRAGSRFGEKRVDEMNMLASLLPGVTVVYYGDEIGMLDRQFSYKETVDVAGCNAGPDRYHLKSRDPERTPFQWDATTSAGFSTSNRTWLPVHSNYKTLNLAAQKRAAYSHYKIFKSLIALKKKPIVADGTVEVTLVTENGLGIVRRLGKSVAALVVNFSKSPITVDARTWLNIPENLVVYTSSLHSGISLGTRVNTASLKIPAQASLLLTTQDLLV